MPFLESSLLREAGFHHAFTTRSGGHSEGAYASLNLGEGIGDDESRVELNHSSACRVLGVEKIWRVCQVHGTEVVDLGRGKAFEAVKDVEADGIIGRKTEAVGIRVADCLPLLLADRATGVVAAIHCGWRGMVAGIAPIAVAAMHVPPSGVIAVIGPHIRPPSFEVGEEVANALLDVSPDAASRTGGRWHGNLAAAVRAQLIKAGVDPTSIDDVGGCTFEDAFFSYRQDGGTTGRQMAVIVARGYAG